MNNLNEDNEDLSACVHMFVRSVVDHGAKTEFLDGPSCCPDDDEELATLYGFVGTHIIKSNIQIILAQSWDHPTPGQIDREVSRICNVKHMATKMMQSFIFPQEIVQEMIAIDHRNNRKIITRALYTSIKAVCTLINGLNGSTIEEGATRGVAVADFCVAIINMNTMSNTKELDFLP
jgi:hypothetical protein